MSSARPPGLPRDRNSSARPLTEELTVTHTSIPAAPAPVADPTASAGAANARTTSATSAAGGAPAVGRRERRVRTALLALQIVLALFYAFGAAAPKLIGVSSAGRAFDQIGFGHWFMYLTGTLELLGGAALVIPVLYQVGAISLIGLMIGATVTQITVFNGDNAATPAILILPLAVIAWTRGDSTTALVALLKRVTGRSTPPAPRAAAQR
jgi:uncharacterized membrane protein YphA (DoxX/SURF4 family)